MRKVTALTMSILMLMSILFVYTPVTATGTVIPLAGSCQVIASGTNPSWGTVEYTTNDTSTQSKSSPAYDIYPNMTIALSGTYNINGSTLAYGVVKILITGYNASGNTVGSVTIYSKTESQDSGSFNLNVNVVATLSGYTISVSGNEKGTLPLTTKTFKIVLEASKSIRQLNPVYTQGNTIPLGATISTIAKITVTSFTISKCPSSIVITKTAFCKLITSGTNPSWGKATANVTGLPVVTSTTQPGRLTTTSLGSERIPLGGTSPKFKLYNETKIILEYSASTQTVELNTGTYSGSVSIKITGYSSTGTINSVSISPKLGTNLQLNITIVRGASAYTVYANGKNVGTLGLGSTEFSITVSASATNEGTKPNPEPTPNPGPTPNPSVESTQSSIPTSSKEIPLGAQLEYTVAKIEILSYTIESCVDIALSLSNVQVQGYSAYESLPAGAQVNLTFTFSNPDNTPISNVTITASENGDTTYDGIHSAKFVYKNGKWTVYGSGWNIEGDPLNGKVTITIGKEAVSTINNPPQWEFTVTIETTQGYKVSASSPGYGMSAYIELDVSKTNVTLTAGQETNALTATVVTNFEYLSGTILNSEVTITDNLTAYVKGLNSGITLYGGTSSSSLKKLSTSASSPTVLATGITMEKSFPIYLKAVANNVPAGQYSATLVLTFQYKVSTQNTNNNVIPTS